MRMGADRDGSMLIDRMRRKKEEKRSGSSAKASFNHKLFAFPFINKTGMLTPYRDILSALHGDDEGDHEYMVIGRGFSVAGP